MGVSGRPEALEKRVQQLEEELDFTHAHYHKLLEQIVKEADATQQTEAEAHQEAPDAAKAATASFAASCTVEPEPSLPPNHHIIQQKRIERLQEQLKAQLQCTKEAQMQSDGLAAQVELLKQEQKGATHRQFQAVRNLDAEVAALKSAAALERHAAALQLDKALDAHEEQVLTLRAANNKLQLQLGELSQAVPVMLRKRSEKAGQQQMAEMALEDKIQAAVDRQVAAVLVGHAQELQNVQEQLQQTLDRRTQVAEAITSAHTAGRMHFFTNELMHSLQEAEASTSAHTAEKAAQGKYISALEEEVGQQYKYLNKLEVVVEWLEQRGAARHLRKDLQLLRGWKPADSQEQRIRALKARLAIASRCHHALQESKEATGSPRPSTAPVSSSARLALLLSQPSEIPPSWVTLPTPTTPAPRPPLPHAKPEAAAGSDSNSDAAVQQQAQTAAQISQLEADVVRYRTALKSEQARSRSLAIALQAKQRLQGQQHCSPNTLQHQQVQHASKPLKSALRSQQQQRQTVTGHVSTESINVQPMTACSILQTKLGSKPSILQRPYSAHTRSIQVSSIHPHMQLKQERPASAKARELVALSTLLP